MPRRGLDTATAGTPSASSCATTSFQPELSANAPCTSATVGLGSAVDAGRVMGIFSSVGAVRRCWGPVSVAGQFPGAEREADRGDLMQVELAEYRSQVGGEGVEVVARRRPARPAEAAPVVGDHPI